MAGQASDAQGNTVGNSRPSEMLENELRGARAMELDGSTRRLKTNTTKAMLVNCTLWANLSYHLIL